MFGSSQPKKQVVLSLSDTEIAYLVVDRDENGFFVIHHERAELPKGIIQNAEVLRAEALTTILKKSYQDIMEHLPKKSRCSFSLLLPHVHFTHEIVGFGEEIPKKTLSRFIQKHLKENPERYPWSRTHSYTFEYSEERNEIAFEALDNEKYSSFRHVCEAAGIKEVGIVSNTKACGTLLENYPTASMILFGDESSYLIGYRNGYCISSQRFEVSYRRCITDITKGLRVDGNMAKKVIREYGVTRSHKDQSVYNQLMRSFTPLIDILRKRKTDKKQQLFTWHLRKPLRGMEEMFYKRVGVSVEELNPLHLDEYPFHEVLHLHKEESYQYSLLIAHAIVKMK